MRYILLLSLFIFTACFNPMGLSDSEWAMLSPQEKAHYSAKQAEINRQKEIEREKRKQKELELKILEKQRINKLYDRAGYGDILVVDVYGGDVKFGRKYKDYKPFSFMIVRGEQKEITFRHKKETSKLKVSFDAGALHLGDSYKKVTILDKGEFRRGKRYFLKSYKDFNFKAGKLNFYIRYKGSSRYDIYHYNR